MVTLGSRYINAQVNEYILRLGAHTWRLSDDERFFLHRYLYLSTLEAMRTLGILYTEQDPLVPTNGVVPNKVPEFLRLEDMQKSDGDLTEAIPIGRSNGHVRTGVEEV